MNWGSVFEGVGALAGAWGAYEASKVEKDKLEYEKSKDAAIEEKTKAAQAELDKALEDVYVTSNKKEKESALGDAFVSTQTVA